MRLYGLIGYPLTHSFSKKYFAEKFQKEGIENSRYELYPISNIDELNEVLHIPGLSGLNVTIPYKEQVIPFLDEGDPVVSRIKACNCIKIENGRLKGYNTDVTGFEVSLKEKLEPHHNAALILGTGGAAKAVEYVLEKLGIAYRYVSRRATSVVFSYDQLSASILKEYTLIINTTPLGMYPAVDEAPPLPYEAITPEHYLFDLIYNPEMTVFLRKGKEKGATIKNGHDMLIIQAEESWRIWNEL